MCWSLNFNLALHLVSISRSSQAEQGRGLRKLPHHFSNEPAFIGITQEFCLLSSGPQSHGERKKEEFLATTRQNELETGLGFKGSHLFPTQNLNRSR